MEFDLMDNTQSLQLGAAARGDADDRGPRRLQPMDYDTYDDRGITEETPPPTLSTRPSTVCRSPTDISDAAVASRRPPILSAPPAVDRALPERPDRPEPSVVSRQTEVRPDRGRQLPDMEPFWQEMKSVEERLVQLYNYMPSHRLGTRLTTPAEFERPVRATLQFDTEHRSDRAALSDPPVTQIHSHAAGATHVSSLSNTNSPQIASATISAGASVPNPSQITGDNYAPSHPVQYPYQIAGAMPRTSQTAPNYPQNAGVPLGDGQTPPNPPPNPSATAGTTTQSAAAPTVGPAVVSSSGDTKRSLPAIKLDSYNGSTPLQTHLSKLNNFAVYNNWGSRDRLCHLKASLTGQAGEVLWQLSPESMEADVVNLLQNRFGSEHQTERYRLELQSRRRQKGESIQSLYNDIRRLLALGWPGKTGDSVVEALGKDYFLAALSDPTLRIRVLDQCPKTLDDALVVVGRMELYSGPGADAGGSASDPDKGKVQEVKADGADTDTAK